ncbi:MAG: hypothetical protein IJF74_01880 [Clostridia bacterium]|nr:hypothetical protein [Clostridia bacterium]
MKMNNNNKKAEYLHPEVEIVSFQPVDVLTANGLSAFNVESTLNNWLLD